MRVLSLLIDYGLWNMCFRVVLETDPNVIAGKVAMQSTESSGSLSEQVIDNMTSTSSLIVVFHLVLDHLGFVFS